jgi:hypothetical protein
MHKSMQLDANHNVVVEVCATVGQWTWAAIMACAIVFHL